MVMATLHSLLTKYLFEKNSTCEKKLDLRCKAIKQKCESYEN